MKKEFAVYFKVSPKGMVYMKREPSNPLGISIVEE